MPLEGLLLELTKVKLLGKYSAEKAFLNYYYLGRTGSEELCSFLLASSKEQIGLRSRKKKNQLTLFFSHTSAMLRHFVPTQKYIFFSSRVQLTQPSRSKHGKERTKSI